MAVDFMSHEGRIELNQEALKTYKEGLDKAAERISLISIIYSLLSIYIIQFIKFIIVHQFENLVFIIFLALLIVCIVISVVWTVKFLLPLPIAHLHLPKYFYTTIKEQYLEKEIPEEKLQEKIRATYLNELEKTVANNYEAYKKRRLYFTKAFNFALIALIPYLICAAVMLGTKEKEEPQKIEIANHDALLLKIDSLISKHK